MGRSGQRPELSQATGIALVRCILGKFLGVACHCFPRRLDVPTFHHQVPPRPPRRERSQRRKWELWARTLSGNFAEMTTSTPFRDLLHAANLRHGTDGFTSPLKIRRLRPGLNPRTWVLKASTLPLDHRSRLPDELWRLKCGECRHRPVNSSLQLHCQAIKRQNRLFAHLTSTRCQGTTTTSPSHCGSNHSGAKLLSKWTPLQTYFHLHRCVLRCEFDMGDVIVVSIQEHFMLLICHMIYGRLCGCSGDSADRSIPILTVS